jgi:hypothetical protein
MKTTIKNGNLDSFNDYLDKCKNQARSEGSKQYFHVDVVAEAYSQGYEHGKEDGQSEFIESLIMDSFEKFNHKSNQIYILSKNVIEYITKELKQNVISLHINLTPNKPSVILSVPNDALLIDEFVDKAYNKVFDIRDIYKQLFDEMLDIGFVGSDHLDYNQIESDGFGYTEKYHE